jgi:hypothetical protein
MVVLRDTYAESMDHDSLTLLYIGILWWNYINALVILRHHHS